MSKCRALILLLLTGCATSVPLALDEIRPGMDKDQVLEKAGNPARTFREAAQDHWIYSYFRGDEEWRRDIIFDSGKVIKVSRALSKNNWMSNLENSESMEEYEAQAREHEKRANNFKSIDGQADDPADK